MSRWALLLQVLKRLTGLPRRKWHAATAPLAGDVPVVPLLGFFWAGQSDAGAALAAAPVPAADSTLWLVGPPEVKV